MLRTIRVTRYVTPLREGGSLPAIVEADDLGLYVLKFRGAGQGPLALLAELVAGEIGRQLGLPIPEIVLAEVHESLGRNEPDEEIRDLLRASVGTNLALDFLPGALAFDPAASDAPDPTMASQVVWFDAFVSNVDRTARNTNLLLWHRALYLIDHGAALYFQHNWQSTEQMAENPFKLISQHVLLPWAACLTEVDRQMRSRLDQALFASVLDSVPDEWFAPDVKRAAYVEYFVHRLKTADAFVREAKRAYDALV